MKTTFLALLAILTFSLAALAADATGTWKGETPGRNGNQPITITLKASGSTLTGKVTTARGDSDIEEGKVDGDNISFVLTTPGRDGAANKQTYKGKVGADSIEFTREGGRGPVTFTAKKQ
ncbi:MAG TPA: hypothetical protein VN519_01605 [Bryobacteraceae bacterium]|nr:hypothetical protein [Bryobacteraceae bacterium]